MADPRFYDNRGPFTLAQVCAAAGIAVPAGADGTAIVADVASLGGAGPSHLAFYAGQASLADAFAQSRAGFCLVGEGGKPRGAPAATVTIPSASVPHAFAAVAALFYPDSSLPRWSQDNAIDPTAEIGAGVTLAPGVVIGPGAAIGEGTRLGPGVAIGRGVLIGRNCEIGSHASISHAYVGDGVTIFPGAGIGQPGFGFASGAGGHVKIPQLGRVIIQDNVEIGASTTVDRGALGDTVIGEGSKFDNLVQIGHNVHVGRHCVMAAQAGIAGSCVIGDFVIIGGQTAIGEYARVGDRARLAARSGVAPYAVLAGGADYGGLPARPVREWIREMHTLARLAARQKRDGHD